MMNKEVFLRSGWFKVLLILVIVALAIGLYQNGYAFGQWLYQLVN